MFKTFAQFLATKGITDEAFNEMSKDEQLKLHKEHSTEAQKEFDEKMEGTASKEEVADMQKALNELKDKEIKAILECNKEQGVALQKLLKNFKGGGELPESQKTQINKWIADNAAKIVELKKAGTGLIKLTLEASKVPAPITTGSATNPDGIPEIAGVQMAPPSRVNLRRAIVETLVTTFTTTQASYAYTESLPKEGDFGFVLEGGAKPQIDFLIETRYATPKKAAAHIVLTDESITDIPGLQNIANGYLRDKHDLKKQNGILFGTGTATTGAEPEGATVLARTFVAGAMALSVATPNFMDVVNACITDIYVTPNFVDEQPYMANIVLINPIDFYIELVSAKDANGLPLYPMAGLFNQVTIGGATIIPEQTIPAGKIFCCDMSKYNVTRYVDYEVQIGWINDQLIKNQFTMVGESRFHAFVKELDKAAFIYDDIATIKAAITKP